MSNQVNLLVAQSGGPTVAINASLAGVISQSMASGKIDKVFGAKNGIQGVLKEELIVLSDIFDNEEKIKDLQHTPSMYLGSCRYKLKDPHQDESDYLRIIEVLKKHNVKYFFYIGGNDSMDTVAKLSKYAEDMNDEIYVMGVPKTIDNDLRAIDHTPGFGSAAKYIATSILEIAHDTAIYDMESVLIVEIMGRNAGWLAASSVLARTEYSTAPDLIYLPERPFSTASFVNDVRQLLKKKKQIIIAVSEGICDVEGTYVSSQEANTDQFGHVRLSGTGKYLEHLIHDTIGCKVRSVELSVLQRCASHIASRTDLEEAFELGKRGVDYAMEGATGYMVRLLRTCEEPYTVEYSIEDIDKIANEERRVPQEWINESGNDVTEEMVTYLKPLIQGESFVTYQNGLPSYLFIKL
ncbi:6-phosphofructokinase [[Clostridium] polysaccharolyticum]|uniref:Pyrophosphate--fructose 6-phosphate 1-phosphotransferase n=1 Tax=[Clostridium] polysaccharolyticum TaxID=29364 RepID=A0A1H9Z6U6_9FIRM|nr:6-phosphofructokinase [[Clostridium] polysaccharolyticum]SES77171.1 6-phosphofructokinase 1 [[Clostridium] polysaccharolyticum]